MEFFKRLFGKLLQPYIKAQAARRVEAPDEEKSMLSPVCRRADRVPFQSGQTIGTTGSEQVPIIQDIESISGARLTVETASYVAPYAVTFGTFGIYVSMFHTHYCENLTQVTLYVDKKLTEIEELFVLYEI